MRPTPILSLKSAAAALSFAACLFTGAASVQAQTATTAPAAPAAMAPAPATAPAAAAPAAAAPAAPAENPYGLEALWRTSDAVAKVVLAILAIMSIGSWYIMVTKYLEQAKMKRQARAAQEQFWKGSTIEQGASSLDKRSAYRHVVESGADAAANHSGLKRHIPLLAWISMNVQGAVDRVNAQSQTGLAFLATVGSTSPFVGLLGTVWGIYHALTAIGISGQASIDKVAGPVGEALIMTAIGLAVAIPAVLGYNMLAKRNKAVMDDVRTFSDEITAVLVGMHEPRVASGRASMTVGA